MDLIPDLFLVILCVNSNGPGEFTLRKLETSEAALIIVKQEVAQCSTGEGSRAGLAGWKGRCVRGGDHPILS